MRKITIFTLVIIICFSGCKSDSNKVNQNNSDSINKHSPLQNSAETELKKRELDLKEKELDLKEKELDTQHRQINSNQSNNSTNNQNNNTRYSGKYPETSTRNLDRTLVEKLAPTRYEKKIMRNEIFARHGYIFKTDDMRNYFNSQSWYVPKYENVNSIMTDIEKYNAELIKYAETGAE